MGRGVLQGIASNDRLVRSTSDVTAVDAASYWSDVVCRSLVEVVARPASPGPFSGRIEHFTGDELGFTVVAANAQHVKRTGTLIARGREDYAMVNIQVSGRSSVAQDGRAAVLSPGAMTFLDSTRPYELRFDDAFSQLIVQVPRSLLPRRALTEATAVELGPGGPGRLIGDFLLGVDRLHRTDPHGAGLLIPHAVGLVSSALGLASRMRPDGRDGAALTRERVHQFVRRHAQDPALDADAVAAGCGISRRTLFRALSADGGASFTSLLRQMRVDSMRRALRSMPQRSLAVLAQECGFAGEAQMYRAFREVTGTTPAAYREAGR